MNNRKIIFLLVVLLLFSGCQSVREKFTRKKKIKQEVPVYVDFKDYPKGATKELYEDYYLYVLGWLDEIIQGLKQQSNFKRVQHAKDEVGRNLDQIMFVLNDQGQQIFAPLYDRFAALSEQLSRSPTTLERNVLLQELEKIKRTFHNEFRYARVSQWIEAE